MERINKIFEAYMVISVAINFIILLVLYADFVSGMRALRKELKKDIKEHQDWLFNQLYSLHPGKVLKPTEKEAPEQSLPAKVYRPSQDPMTEFKGTQDDWHK